VILQKKITSYFCPLPRRLILVPGVSSPFLYNRTVMGAGPWGWWWWEPWE